MFRSALLTSNMGADNMGTMEHAATGSFAVEVIADASGEWCGNAMRYPTYRAADAAGYSLSRRWTLVREYRVVRSEDAPNADRDGRLL